VRLSKGQGESELPTRQEGDSSLIRRLLADLGDREGDEPVVVFARDLRAVLVMLAALDGYETKRGELNR